MCHSQRFLTRLLTSGISFSTALRAVSKLVSDSALTSFILALRIVIVTKLVVTGILSSIFFIFSLFLTISFFTTLLNLLKSTGVVSNFTISNLSTLLFKLLKLAGTFINLSISNSSTSGFKLTRSDFAANFYIYQFPLHFLNQILFHN